MSDTKMDRLATDGSVSSWNTASQALAVTEALAAALEAVCHGAPDLQPFEVGLDRWVVHGSPLVTSLRSGLVASLFASTTRTGSIATAIPLSPAVATVLSRTLATDEGALAFLYAWLVVTGVADSLAASCCRFDLGHWLLVLDWLDYLIADRQLAVVQAASQHLRDSLKTAHYPDFALAAKDRRGLQRLYGRAVVAFLRSDREHDWQAGQDIELFARALKCEPDADERVKLKRLYHWNQLVPYFEGRAEAILGDAFDGLIGQDDDEDPLDQLDQLDQEEQDDDDASPSTGPSHQRDADQAVARPDLDASATAATTTTDQLLVAVDDQARTGQQQPAMEAESGCSALTVAPDRHYRSHNCSNDDDGHDKVVSSVARRTALRSQLQSKLIQSLTPLERHWLDLQYRELCDRAGSPIGDTFGRWDSLTNLVDLFGLPMPAGVRNPYSRDD